MEDNYEFAEEAKRLAAAMPPLTDEQRDLIALAFRGVRWAEVRKKLEASSGSGEAAR